MNPIDSINTNARRIELMLQAEFHALHIAVYAARIKAACAYIVARDSEKQRAS